MSQDQDVARATLKTDRWLRRSTEVALVETMPPIAFG